MTTRKFQSGLSLISLLVTLTIGTVLLAGLFILWLQTKKSFTAQDQLAQVQENQRIATTLIANTVQTGGYFPIYLNYSATPPATPYSLPTALPDDASVSTLKFAAGQSIVGNITPTTQGDQIAVRYMADSSQGNQGNTLDCLGQQHPTGTVVVNTYQVDTNGDLTCSVNGGTAQPVIAGTISGGALTSGIASMSIVYGVDTSPIVGTANSTNDYLTAAQVNSANLWSDVTSVVVTLNFLNPYYGQAGQSKQYLPITRVIAITQTAP